MKPERDEAVFLVRMWRPGERAMWRGSVHEIGSDIRFYVSGTSDVAEFIGTRLAERPEHPASGEASSDSDG